MVIYMETDISILVIGMVLGVWNAYLFFKIKGLEFVLKTIPSPEELAKEVLKVKLPLSDLPPELAEKVKGVLSGKLGSPIESPEYDRADENDKIAKYIG